MIRLELKLSANNSETPVISLEPLWFLWTEQEPGLKANRTSWCCSESWELRRRWQTCPDTKHFNGCQCRDCSETVRGGQELDDLRGKSQTPTIIDTWKMLAVSFTGFYDQRSSHFLEAKQGQWALDRARKATLGRGQLQESPNSAWLLLGSPASLQPKQPPWGLILMLMRLRK